MDTKYFFLACLMFFCRISFSQVSINSDGALPDGKAMLDVKSTSRGLLIPRMNRTEITNIFFPSDGLTVFCTTDNKTYVFNAVENVWKAFQYGSGTIISWFCGSSFTDDRDGKIYNTVQIGNQCWMKQNLNAGTRINGTGSQTNNGLIEKYCYNNLESNCDIYGGLYIWDEMMNYTTASNSNPSGRQGICPAGWHVPSDAEWCDMETYLDVTVNCINSGFLGTDIGGKLKEAGTSHWSNPNTGATNASGFTALPGGGGSPNGSFYDLNLHAQFWTASEVSDGVAHFFILAYNNEKIERNNGNKTLNEMSARCVKDN